MAQEEVLNVDEQTQPTKEIDFSAFDNAVKKSTKKIDFSAFDNAVGNKPKIEQKVQPIQNAIDINQPFKGMGNAPISTETPAAEPSEIVKPQQSTFDFAKSKSTIDALKDKIKTYTDKVKQNDLSDDDKRELRTLQGQLGKDLGSIAVQDSTSEKLHLNQSIGDYNTTVNQIGDIAKKYKSLTTEEQKDYQNTVQSLNNQITQHNQEVQKSKTNQPDTIKNVIDVNQPFGGMFKKAEPKVENKDRFLNIGEPVAPTTLKNRGGVQMGIQPIAATDKADIEEAINNAVAVKKKQFPTIGDRAKEQILADYKNGDLVPVKLANGKSVLKRSDNIWDSFSNAVEEEHAINLENNYLVNLPNDKKVEYVLRKMENPDVYNPESESAPGSDLAKGTKFIGENISMIGKGATAAMLGAATEFTGGATMGSFLSMVKDLAEGGYRQRFEQNVIALKTLHPEMTNQEIYDKAHPAALLGEVINIATGAVLSGSVGEMISGKVKIPKPTVPIVGASNAIINAAKHAVATSPKVLLTSAAGSVINDIASNVIGADVPVAKMVENAKDNTEAMAIMHFGIAGLLMPFVAAKAAIPSYVRPQLENIVASADRQQVAQVYNQMEQNGSIPEGTTIKILNHLSEYDEQKAIVAPFRISEENKAAIAGKLLQRKKLLEEKLTLDPVFSTRLSEIDKEIGDINSTIEKMYKSKNVLEQETDTITGEAAIPKAEKPIAEAIPTIEPTDNIKVGEMLDKTGTYKGVKGSFSQEGQTIIFKEEGKDRIHEIGNIDEVKDMPISDFDIKHEESIVSIDNDGNFNVRNEVFVNPFEQRGQNPTDAILYDKDGNVVNVRMKTADGKRRTFKGNIAEDLAYQIHLKEINKNNETRAAFEQHINEDTEAQNEINNAGLPKTTEGGAVESNEQVPQQEVVQPKAKVVKVKTEPVEVLPEGEAKQNEIKSKKADIEKRRKAELDEFNNTLRIQGTEIRDSKGKRLDYSQESINDKYDAELAKLEKETAPTETAPKEEKTAADTVHDDLLTHLGITEEPKGETKFQLEKSNKVEPKEPILKKKATKSEKLKYSKELEKYRKEKALYDQDIEALKQANQEVSGIFDRAEIEQNQLNDNPINIDTTETKDIPTQKIEVSPTDKRPEATVMSNMVIKMGDWIKGAKVALGMSDTLRTGERKVTELDSNGNKVTKTIRDEGGIGFPFKSLLDLVNGKIEEGKKAMGWAAVGEGAGTSMINAAKKSKKITGKELKEHYYKNLDLTKEQKQRLEDAIKDDKEYGLVTIYKMGEEGIRSNEAFAKEAFRLMDVKLNEEEKLNAFKIAEDRLDKIEWGKDGVKEKYIDKLKAAKTFEELEKILNGDDSDMSLGTKAEIMQKIFLGTEKTTSTEKVNPLSALLKEKGISIEGISKTLEEPIMSGIDAGQPMILLAIDPNSKVVKDTNRHANYSYGVEGFPVGLFNETSQMHHLSPEMMDTFVKTATTSVDENVKIKGTKEKARISISHDNKGNYIAELGKGADKVQFTDKKGIFTKADGKFYDSKGKPIKETANLLSLKSKELINEELKNQGYTVSEASKENYNQDISGSNISNLMQKAKAGIINFFENPETTAQQKLVKYINLSFPNVDISLDAKEYKAIEQDFRNKKLLNVNQKTFGVVDSKTGKVYLNPELLNNNTPIHELGHVWNIYAKEYKPEIYNKGLELITDTKNSKYLDFVLNNTKYQKLISDVFGNDALLKNKETGKYDINTEHKSFNDIKEYVADEALAKAIGDKGELFVNEAQKRNWEKFLDTLYAAIKKVVGFGEYTVEQFQNLKLEDFVNSAIKDILGGKEISKISSKDLSDLTKDVTLPKFQLGDQDSKIKDFIEIQRQKGISDKDIQAGLEKASEKIGIDKAKIEELMSTPKVEAKGDLQSQYDGIKSEKAKKKFITKNFGEVSDEQLSDIVKNNTDLQTIKDKIDAIQKSGAGEVLQPTPQGNGSQGGKRGGMEQGEQGAEATTKKNGEENGDGQGISKAAIKSKYGFTKKFEKKSYQSIADNVQDALQNRADNLGISIEQQAANEVANMKNKVGEASEHDIMTAALHLNNLDAQIEKANNANEDTSVLLSQREDALSTLRQLGNNAGRNLRLFAMAYKITEEGKLEVIKSNLKNDLGVDNIPKSVAELNASNLSKEEKDKLRPYVAEIQKVQKDLADIKFETDKKIKEATEKGLQDYVAKQKNTTTSVSKGAKLSIETAKKVSNNLRNLADKVENFSKTEAAKGAQTQGIDIQKSIADAIRYVADKIESGDIPDVVARAIEKFAGEGLLEKDLKSKLHDALISAGIPKESLEGKTTKENAIEKIKGLAEIENATTITKDMASQGLVNDIFNDYIKKDVPYEELVKMTTDELKKTLPNVTESDVLDVILNKGEFKKETKEKIKSDIQVAKENVKRLANTQAKINALQVVSDINDIKNDNTLSVKEKKDAIEAKKSEYEKSLDDKLKELQKQSKIAKVEQEINYVKNEKNIYNNALKEPKKANAELQKAQDVLKNEYNKQGIRKESGSKTEIKIAQDSENAINEIKNSNLPEDIKKEHIKAIEDQTKEQLNNTKQGVLNNLKESIDSHISDLVNKAKDALDNKMPTDKINELKRDLQDLSNKLKPNLENLKDQIDKADQDLQAIIESNKGTEFAQDLKIIQQEYHKDWQKTSNELQAKELTEKARRSVKEAERRMAAGQFTEIPNTELDIKTNEILAKEEADKKTAWSKLTSMAQNAREQRLSKSLTAKVLEARRDIMIASFTAIEKVVASGVTKPIIDPLLKQTFGRLSSLITGIRPTEAKRLGGTLRQLKNESSANSFMAKMNDNYIKEVKEHEKLLKEFGADSPQEKAALKKLKSAELDNETALAYLFINAGSHIDIAQVMLKGATDFDAKMGKYKQSFPEQRTKMEGLRFWIESVNRSHGAIKSISHRQSLLDHYIENLQYFQDKNGNITPENRTMAWDTATLMSEEGRFGEKTLLSDWIAKQKNSENAAIRNTANFAAPVAKIGINIAKQGIDMAMPFELLYKTTSLVKEGISKNALEGKEFNNALTRIREGLKTSFDDLPLEQKKRINTLITRGLFGVAQYALVGYMLGQGKMKFGGSYDENDPFRRNKVMGADGTPLDYGEWEINGVKLPKLVGVIINHSPYFLPAALATVAHQQYNSVKEKDATFIKAVSKVTNEVYERLPIANAIGIAQALMGNEYKLEHILANEVPTMKNVAEYTDKDAQGNPIKRETKGEGFLSTTGNIIKSKIPGARQTLPVKYSGITKSASSSRIKSKLKSKK